MGKDKTQKNSNSPQFALANAVSAEEKSEQLQKLKNTIQGNLRF